MPTRLRIVLDTSALVSRLLVAQSVPAQAVRRAEDQAHVLVSEATLDELLTVLQRPKFDRYVALEKRLHYVRLFACTAELVPVRQRVQACRDPRDDKFLEVAVNGAADLIVTSDQDLLVLNPFRDIPILTPAAYLVR